MHRTLISVRQRRIKCDEAKIISDGRESCQRCLNSGRVCGGYESDVRPLRLIQYGVIAPTIQGSQSSQGDPPATPPSIAFPFLANPNRHHVSFILPRLSRPIGGLRVDPFDALPITSTPDVKLAFDNCKLHAVPDHSIVL